MSLRILGLLGLPGSLILNRQHWEDVPFVLQNAPAYVPARPWSSSSYTNRDYQSNKEVIEGTTSPYKL